MKQAGPALGLAQYAAAIVQTPDGSYAVPDPAARAAIMKLRSDPAVSAKMAGVFTRSNEAKLAASIGRPPSEGELYIAHFLGSEGASKLIAAAANQPQANAATMFPAAAAANRAIFYDRAGNPLNAGTVYRGLTGRYEVARALAFSAQETPPQPAAAADPAAVTQAYAQAHAASVPAPKRPVQENKPLFQAMFTDVPRPGVSPTVSKLWSPASGEPAQPPPSSGLYDLFKDAPPALRKTTGGKV